MAPCMKARTRSLRVCQKPSEAPSVLATCTRAAQSREGGRTYVHRRCQTYVHRPYQTYVHRRCQTGLKHLRCLRQQIAGLHAHQIA